MIQVRKGTYRGVTGWRIVGTDNYGRRLGIFHNGTEAQARWIAAKCKALEPWTFDEARGSA